MGIPQTRRPANWRPCAWRHVRASSRPPTPSAPQWRSRGSMTSHTRQNASHSWTQPPLVAR
eukprot:2695532-Pleurochrysis_carterae.AAC.1